ncbi:hypothetical protein MTO96_006879 [Rhipicephalus appendiculatus]
MPSPGGNGKSAFLRMFRFGKDKGDHQGTSRRRMSDAAMTEASRKEELPQWSSVPVAVGGSPEAKHRQDATLVMRAHTLPHSREAAPSGSECPDGAGGDVNVIRSLMYCDSKAEGNGDLIRLLRTKSNLESRSGKVISDAVLTRYPSPGHDI